MDIGYVWDAGKYNEVKRKHGVSFYGVVSAFEDKCNFETSDPAGHAGRFMLVGWTTAGRFLQVVFAVEDWPLYRVITAFDAERRWVDECHERRGV